MKSTLFWLAAMVILAIGVAHLPEAQAEDSPFKMFEKLDINRDKRLSEQEFVGDKEGAAKARAKKQFRRLDHNGDKSLSFQEFKNI